jgi:hypothetical protein
MNMQCKTGPNYMLYKQTSIYAENRVSLQGERWERERKEHACCLKFYLNRTISSIYNTLWQDQNLTKFKVYYISVIITN